MTDTGINPAQITNSLSLHHQTLLGLLHTADDDIINLVLDELQPNVQRGLLLLGIIEYSYEDMALPWPRITELGRLVMHHCFQSVMENNALRARTMHEMIHLPAEAGTWFHKTKRPKRKVQRAT